MVGYAGGFAAGSAAGLWLEGRLALGLAVTVRRRQIRRVLAQVDRWDPGAVVSVGEPRAIRRGWMFSGRRK